MDLSAFSERALLWIVLLPLFGAVINGVFGRFADKKLVGTVAVGSVALAFLLAVLSFVHLSALKEETGTSARIVNDVYDWFTLYLGSSPINIRVAFAFDSLSGIMTLVVTGIGLLIHIYSLEYMEDDPGYARFFTYLNLFMASMLILVLGSSMPVMFVGWEGVGLCSYLLIGFWYQTPEYAAAGKKAFIVNRIGDFGVLIGMFVLFSVTRSLEFSDINTASGLGTIFTLGRLELGTVATVAGLFIFLGCTGKSAQIPLFTWLPDAMAGPTPVSALIHAATMVTAGVYLCCRLSAVFMQSTTAMAVIAIVGALTALLAASIALVQNQMKRILAYSTVSQLGFMFAAVGSGAFTAGIFHVFTHAFFKACLFLGAGAVMHAVHAHGDADIRKLGGLKDKLPVVHWTFLVSCLAISGFPFLSGWFSKDEILLGALTSTEMFESAWIGWFVFVVLLAAATMTAFYMFRMYFLAFHGEYRSAPHAHGQEDEEDEEGEEGEEHGHAHAHDDEHGYDPHPHRPGARIAGVLSVLGAGAGLVGFLNLAPVTHLFAAHGEEPYGDFWGHWLEGNVRVFHADIGALSYLALAGGFLAMAGGIGFAYVTYVQQRKMPVEHPQGLHAILMNKWYVDELYDKTVVRLMRFLAVFAGSFDKYFVDGILARATALVVEVVGWLSTRIQTGVVYTYGAVMMVGVAVIGWWFTFPHAELEATASATEVSWVASRGMGYEYRWDLDDDGELDTEWSATENTKSQAYTAGDFVGLALVIMPAGIGGEEREVLLDPAGDDESLSEGELGMGWQADPEADGSSLPSFRFDPTEEGLPTVSFRKNGARARVRGGEAQEEEDLGVGDVVQVGAVTVRIGGVVRGRVVIRNAFGNMSEQTEEVIIRTVAAAPPTEGEVAMDDTRGGAR